MSAISSACDRRARFTARADRIIVERLAYAEPDGRALLDDLALVFGGERTGLVGPHGSGKTTLVRLLAGGLTPSSGSVHRGGAGAVLPQEFRPAPEAPLAVVLGIEERLAALRRRTAGEAAPADFELVGDDWSVLERVAAVLARFGLAHLPLDQPVGAVRGGEATRVGLAGLALGHPDFLLLDEPTNHLDAASREAPYPFVAEWTGGLLCVSHDRALLRRMDRVVELSPLGVRMCGGGYDAYRARRATDDAAAARELDSARAALPVAEREGRAVRERRARREAQGRRERATANMPEILLNGRRAQAQATGARIRAVTEREVEERRERARAARQHVEERERPRFALPSTRLSAGRTVPALEDVFVRFPGARLVLDGVTLHMVGPERVAVVDLDGSGKSTLPHVALGHLVPHASTVCRPTDEESAYLGQHGVALDPTRSVLENFRARRAGASRPCARRRGDHRWRRPCGGPSYRARPGAARRACGLPRVPRRHMDAAARPADAAERARGRWPPAVGCTRAAASPPGGVFRQVEEYDPATRRGRSLAPMPVGRRAMGLAALGDRLYLIGGAGALGTPPGSRRRRRPLMLDGPTPYQRRGDRSGEAWVRPGSGRVRSVLLAGWAPNR